MVIPVTWTTELSSTHMSIFPFDINSNTNEFIDIHEYKCFEHSTSKQTHFSQSWLAWNYGRVVGSMQTYMRTDKRTLRRSIAMSCGMSSNINLHGNDVKHDEREAL